MTTTNEKRTTTTTPTSTAGSSTTRAHAHVREDMIQTSLANISTSHMDILGRPMPRFTERQLMADLQSGTPWIYYSYALQEAAAAPMPSWRYVLAIVARLKRQQIPEEDLLWMM